MIFLSVAHSRPSPGAVGLLGLKEHDVSVIASRACCEHLKNHGVETVLYDCGDLPPSRYDDAKISAANRASPDIAIEIHCNSNLNRLACYSEVIHHPLSVIGRLCAKSISLSLEALTKSNSAWKANGPRGDSGLFFLNKTKCPSLIVEGLFISNPEQEKWLKNGGSETYGLLVAEGVLEWIKQR